MLDQVALEGVDVVEIPPDIAVLNSVPIPFIGFVPAPVVQMSLPGCLELRTRCEQHGDDLVSRQRAVRVLSHCSITFPMATKTPIAAQMRALLATHKIQPWSMPSARTSARDEKTNPTAADLSTHPRRKVIVRGRGDTR